MGIRNRQPAIPPQPPVPFGERAVTAVADSIDYTQIISSLTGMSVERIRDIFVTVGSAALQTQVDAHWLADSCGLPVSEARVILAQFLADAEIAQRGVGQVSQQAVVDEHSRMLRNLSQRIS